MPNIIKALHKQLKEKSVKSRQGCFTLLTELAGVLPGCLADHIPALVPGKTYLLVGREQDGKFQYKIFSFSDVKNLNSLAIVTRILYMLHFYMQRSADCCPFLFRYQSANILRCGCYFVFCMLPSVYMAFCRGHNTIQVPTMILQSRIQQKERNQQSIE